MTVTRLDVNRHFELFNPFNFEHPVHIIGAGATGSWLAMQLAKLGIMDITVYDFDTVEEHNIPNQIYGIGDIGKTKVAALRERIANDTGTAIKTQTTRFDSGRLSGIVFMMVDSMAARKAIWLQSIKYKSLVQLLIEPRMGLSFTRIYNVVPTSSVEVKAYEETLYSDAEAQVSSCGVSQSVITTASTVASICARQLINFHANEELASEILFDMQYNNLITTRW